MRSDVARQVQLSICPTVLIKCRARASGAVLAGLLLCNAMLVTFVWAFRLVQKRPHVAHLHVNSYAGFFRVAMLAVLAKALKVATVLHVHGAEFHLFYERSSKIIKRLIRWLLSTNDRVVALSDQWKTFFESIGVPSDRIIVLKNSVKLPSRQACQDGEDVAALFLGRLEQRKGVREILAAIAEHRDRMLPCRFVLAGPASAEFEDIELQVRDLAIQDIISVPGPLVGAAKDRAFRDAQIFLLPSFNEGLPIGLLEAMSYGLACITTPVGGIPAVIADEVNGLLVPPGDASALAEAMVRLAHAPGLRRRLGQAARETIERSLSWRIGASKLLALYRDVYNKRSEASVSPVAQAGEKGRED